MSWAFVVLPAFSLAGGAAWYFTRSRRHQRDPQTLISSLHAREMENLNDFLSSDLDLISEDPEFWRRSGGIDGMIRKWQNARILVKLCQHMTAKSEISPTVSEEMTRRSVLIGLMVVCSLPESLLRVFFSELPHLCARVAMEIYSQMTGEIRFLCFEHCEDLQYLANQIDPVL